VTTCPACGHEVPDRTLGVHLVLAHQRPSGTPPASAPARTIDPADVERVRTAAERHPWRSALTPQEPA
jgi:hypothetical protein